MRVETGAVLVGFWRWIGLDWAVFNYVPANTV